jgi:thioredoxin 1
MTIEIKDNDISGLLADERLVMIDFWAGWCGPCKQMAPNIELASEELAERLLVAKANVDENPELSAKYNIRSIPTLLFFRRGQAVGRHVGTIDRHKLWEKIEDVYLESQAENK